MKALILLLSIPCLAAEKSPEKRAPMPLKEGIKESRKLMRRPDTPDPEPVQSDKTLLKLALANAYIKKIGWERVEQFKKDEQ